MYGNARVGFPAKNGYTTVTPAVIISANEKTAAEKCSVLSPFDRQFLFHLIS